MINTLAVPAGTMLINMRIEHAILLARNSEPNERCRIRRMIEENGISPIVFNMGDSALIAHMIMMDVAMKIGDDRK